MIAEAGPKTCFTAARSALFCSMVNADPPAAIILAPNASALTVARRLGIPVRGP